MFISTPEYFIHVFLDKLFVCNVDCAALDVGKVCEELRTHRLKSISHTDDKTQACNDCHQVATCVCAQPLDMKIMNSPAHSNAIIDKRNGLVSDNNGTASPTLAYLKDIVKSPSQNFASVSLSIKNGSKRFQNLNTDGINAATTINTPPKTPVCPSVVSNSASKKASVVTITQNGNSTVIEISNKSANECGSGSKPSNSRPPLFSGVYPPEFYDLMRRLLDVNPNTRISAEQALLHPFLRGARVNL